MSEKRTLLRHLSSALGPAAALAKRSPAFDGDTRIETRNTTYYFQDGVCCEVKRHDGRPATSEFIGMRVVGWLVHGGAEAVLEHEWRAGAYAVLYREAAPRDNRPGNFALTSPAMAFVAACDSSARHRMASRPSLGAFGWAPAARADGPLPTVSFRAEDDVMEAAAVVTEAPAPVPMLPAPRATIPPSSFEPAASSSAYTRPSSAPPPSVAPKSAPPKSAPLPPRPVALPRARTSTVPPPLPAAAVPAPRSGVVLTAHAQDVMAPSSKKVGFGR